MQLRQQTSLTIGVTVFASREPQNPAQTQNPVRADCFYLKVLPKTDLNSNIRTADARRKSMEQSLFYPGVDATTIAMNYILWFRDQVKKGVIKPKLVSGLRFGILNQRCLTVF